MFVSLKTAPVAFWKTAIILVRGRWLFCAPFVCAYVCMSVHPHTCVHMINSECSVCACKHENVSQ